MFAAARSIRYLRGFATEAKAPDAVKQWSLREFLGRNGQGVFNIGVSFAVTVLASQVLSAKQLRESLEVEVDAARGEIQTLRNRVRERRVPEILSAAFCRARRSSRLVAPVSRHTPPPQVSDPAALRSIAGRLKCDAAALEREIKLALDPPPVEPAPPAAPPSII